MMGFLKEQKYLFKPFLIISLIYLLGILTIVLANTHYADDAARTNYGYAGWSAFSRYISTFLSHAVHADNYLANIAPLPQILATLILAVSSIVVICVVSGKDIFKREWTQWVLKVIAVVPLGLCPYMLECLSYQYDSIYMALSVFFAVMPFIFYRQENWKFVLASIVGVLGVCMTYQASIGIYPMLTIFICMKDWNNKTFKNKIIIKKTILAAVVFSLTLLFFQKVLMQTQDIYVSNTLPDITEIIPSTFSHLVHYFELLIQDFRLLWLVTIGIIMVMFIVLFALRSKQPKILSMVVGLIGLILMGAMAYLFYAVLEKPLYTTRAMYAVGTLIAILSLYVVSGGIVKKYDKTISNKKSEAKLHMSIKVNELWLAIPVVVIFWCFFSFSFVYGNALHEQESFRNMQVDMVIADLNQILLDDTPRKIQTVGQIGFAPTIEHMPAGDYYIVKRLLKSSYGSDVPWMAYRLKEASGIRGLLYDLRFDGEKAIPNLPMVKTTNLYNIYAEGDSVVVDFKGKEFSVWEN